MPLASMYFLTVVTVLVVLVPFAIWQTVKKRSGQSGSASASPAARSGDRPSVNRTEV